mmetsp:Transcript_22481/g.73001  ORF Transcript_22481/g.73001 Transcript_22481/m.73001 type:complete len:294 (-) Transcript_22481:1217-2098(-)
MTWVGGTSNSLLIWLDKYWLRSARSSSFCFWSACVSSRDPSREERSLWYLRRPCSSAFQMRNIFSLMTFDMRAQNSFSSLDSAEAAVARATTEGLPAPACACCSASTNVLSRCTTSSGLTSSMAAAAAAASASGPAPASTLPSAASSAAESAVAVAAGPSAERCAARTSSVVASVTPRCLRHASIVRPARCSGVSELSWSIALTFCVMRKPASSQMSSASFMNCGDVSLAVSAASASSDSSRVGASLAVAESKTSSGACHLRPSCCWWMILSASSTFFTRPATISSFMARTSL